MTESKLTQTLKSLLFLSVTILLLMQCHEEDKYISPDELLKTPSNVTSNNNAKESALSLNISGIHAFAPDKVTCKTCAYVIPANTFIIDGEKLGLKPGDVICLNAAIKYGSLDFINLNGTLENPIVIANCDSRESLTSSPTK